jgi:cytochrome b6-f complex iron-sulfur subunit
MDREPLEHNFCPLPPLEGGEEDDEEAPLFSRRGFLRVGLGTLGTLALVEVGAAGFLFLRSHSLEGQFGGTVTAGVVDDFPPGSVTDFHDSHFFLVRAPDGGFLAVHNRCTHLGCTVNWVPADNGFQCPCHAASFDFYGNMEGPPVPRPLDTFSLAFDGGLVQVDTSQPQQRATFRPEQLAYAPGSRPAERSLRAPDPAGPSTEG